MHLSLYNIQGWGMIPANILRDGAVLFVCVCVVTWSQLTATSSSPDSSHSLASASWVAGTTGVRHHAQLIFVFLVETGFHCVGQDDLDLLISWSARLDLLKCWDCRPEPLRLALFCNLDCTFMFIGTLPQDDFHILTSIFRRCIERYFQGKLVFYLPGMKILNINIFS